MQGNIPVSLFANAAKRALRFVFAMALIVLMGACGLPKQHQVRSGVDPRYYDDDVMFRTTYYFRVFDFCDDGATSDPTSVENRILSDSLYRFRMTGKANSTTNKVRFEAGTLKASEIDPFGAEIVFDFTNNRFQFKSQSKSDEEAVWTDALNGVKKLKDFYTSTLADLDSDAATPFKDQAQALMKKLLERIGARAVTVNPGEKVSPADTGAGSAAEATKTEISCDSGRLRRGFRVFGPEGWRTFDPEERLILAMSSSGKPLIDVMRELADRILKSNGNVESMTKTLTQEQLRTVRAQRLNELGGGSPKDLVDATISEFGR